MSGRGKGRGRGRSHDDKNNKPFKTEKNYRFHPAMMNQTTGNYATFNQVEERMLNDFQERYSAALAKAIRKRTENDFDVLEPTMKVWSGTLPSDETDTSYATKLAEKQRFEKQYEIAYKSMYDKWLEKKDKYDEHKEKAYARIKNNYCTGFMMERLKGDSKYATCDNDLRFKKRRLSHAYTKEIVGWYGEWDKTKEQRDPR